MRFFKRFIATSGLLVCMVGLFSSIGVSAAETGAAAAPVVNDGDIIIWFAVAFALCAGGLLPWLNRGKNISLK